MSSVNAGERRRRRAGKRLRIAIIIVAVLAAAAAAAYAYTRSPAPSPSDPSSSGGGAVKDFVNSFKPLGVTNILLIGNNARNPATPISIGSGGGQADIMMIAHIDPATKQVELISIPRDLLFAMPQYQNPIPKIKTMFFIGARMHPNQAVQLTVKAVEKFTGMTIDHWVVTDFKGFEDAINAVGGVRVYVPGRIYEPVHAHANLQKGWQTLNGAQALSFVRVRQNTASSAGSSDFQRDDYQAEVLAALQQKLLNKKNDLAHIGPLITTWMKDVRTDMSYATLVKVATAVQGAKISHMNLANIGDSMEVASAPAPGLNQENRITGAYYDIVDPTQLSTVLKPFGSTGVWTGVPLPAPADVPVKVEGSIAYIKKLRAAGYPVTVTALKSASKRVEIEYPPGHMAWGLQVGRTLATGNSLVTPGTDPSAVVVLTP